MKNDAIKIYFGGEAREMWTNEGLSVRYIGGVELSALRRGDGFAALAPEPGRSGDVKADMAQFSRARELAARLNSGSAPPLTLAYFQAAANAREGLGGGSVAALRGGYEALILPETLRLLLDERGLGWDEALSMIARSFVYMAEGDGASAPLGAVSALQPRTARLISAVNEKLCQRLWAAFPGDWRRIGESAVLRDGEIDFSLLCAAMCGETHCSKERRAGRLRTLFTLFPARFKTDDHN